MPIEPGALLLHYRLIDRLGEGGMGVVWRAVDTTLDREVAIKVLPDDFAADEERLARFNREAKVLASLNHPNIAGIHGLHDDPSTGSGLRFIAMELVPGEDLAARLQAGALDTDEALGIARQVAAALAAAHDSGVIHRDLKPANIRLTPEGVVKVLDFGLAKALDTGPVSGSFDASRSPTITSLGTRAGVILGTAAYMSPEQARGKPVDRRADIWAFGCVLYEMLTGRQAFGGDTVTDVLAAILTREPDLASLGRRVPRRVTRLLERCLTKDAARRLRDAGDIGLELDAVLAGDTAVEDGPGRRSWGLTASIAAAALVVGALAAWLAVGGGVPAPAKETRRMSVTTGDGRAIRDVSIARDGRMLILTLDDGAYLRPLDRFELQPIPDSKRLLTWAESPDGRSIAFSTSDDDIIGSGTLRRLSLETGKTVTIGGSHEKFQPLVWRPDGIVGTANSKIVRYTLDSAATEVLFELERGHFHGVHAIPDRSAVLAVVHEEAGDVEWFLAVLDLAAKTQRIVVPDVRDGVVAAGGHLLFLRDGTLIVSRFDLDTLKPVGEPVPMISDVGAFSVADDGTLAYLPASADAGRSRVVRLGRDGEQEVLSDDRANHIRHAPNGRWIGVAASDTFELIDTRNGSVRPLLNEGVRFADHVWRPDSRAVVYAAHTVGTDLSTIVEHPLDGGAPRVVYDPDDTDVNVYPTGYAPDGSGLVFARYTKEDSDLWWLPADGSDARPLLATKASEDLARFAPNGRFVAYESTESGRQEVWVAVYRADEGRLAEKWKVSSSGGRDPLWAPDGRTLYFETFDEDLAAVDVTESQDGQPVFGDRRVQFDLRALDAAADGDESYDVAPDGEHWIFIQGGFGGAAEVRVVLGWLDEVGRVVGGGG